MERFRPERTAGRVQGGKAAIRGVCMCRYVCMMCVCVLIPMRQSLVIDSYIILSKN